MGQLTTCMIKGVIKCIGNMLSQYFPHQNMSQFQYCLSIDPDHHKCVSNLHWIVMQMYKLKTEVQNNHGINFRLVGIMQGCGQEKQIGRLSVLPGPVVWNERGPS